MLAAKFILRVKEELYISMELVPLVSVQGQWKMKNFWIREKINDDINYYTILTITILTEEAPTLARNYFRNAVANPGG